MTEIVSNFKGFLLKCTRVWAVMKKPTKQEFRIVAQAAGLGILLVGAIGFAISLLMRFFYLSKLF